MAASLEFYHRHPAHRVNRPLWRRLAKVLIEDLLRARDCGLAVHLVEAAEMTALNEAHLRHAGSTDVITFDYCTADRPGQIEGEIFICLDEAIIQARRFRTTWQAELARYLTHGLLHLLGYDDRRAAARQRMKRREDCLLRELRARFTLADLAAPPARGAGRNRRHHTSTKPARS